jgi:hypothetical protein
MRVRHLIIERKVLESDSGWRSDDLTPRNAPIFIKTKPIRAGWQWRSAKAIGQSGNFILLAECNARRANWKSMLMFVNPDRTASVIARFEQHGSHPGLHMHSDCRRSGIEIGATSIDGLLRIPNAASDSHHRRVSSWTENSFWEASKRFFRARDREGELL